MQCTSFIPVYYHARDLNAGASGFPWHLFNNNADYGEERGYNISLPPFSMDQYLSYDKEVLGEIMQSHEATFRYQVQELHRLYRRQRELMDEMRMRQIFAQHLPSQTSESIHCLSHSPSDISQTSHAPSWLLGDRSHSKLPELTAENIQEQTTISHAPIIRKNSYNEVKFLSTHFKGNEKRILDLELPADVYHDDEVKQSKVGILSGPPELTCNPLKKIHPASDSEVKTGDLSSFCLNPRKGNCLIDLNEEPTQLDSLPSSSSAPFETCIRHMEVMHKDLSSDGRSNSSVTIDLNSMPMGCFSETQIILENNSVEDTKMDEKFVKNGTYIDLNTGIALDEPSPLLSSSTVQIKSTGDTILEGPVSPENEECSPPRGKSEDIQLEPSALLSVQHEGEPSMELDTIAARTLLMISSSDVTEPLINHLYWFAEIVSFTGDDPENEVTKIKNEAADNDQGELRIYDSEAITLKGSKKNSLNLSHVVKKENSRKRRTKQNQFEGFLETGSLRRNAWRKACAKPRKYSKLSPPSDVVMKSISSILKQPATRSKQGVLQSWGKIRKREGARRRASKFLVIS